MYFILTKSGDFDWEDIFGKVGARWFHTGGIFAGLSDTTPQLVIEAGGEALALDQMRRLWEVRVRQRLSQPSQCELTFLEPDESSGFARSFSIGSTLRVSGRGFEVSLVESGEDVEDQAEQFEGNENHEQILRADQ